MLPVTICMTIQEVAVEAWILTILGENKAKGSFSINLGIAIGFWVSYPVFTMLSSYKMIQMDSY